MIDWAWSKSLVYGPFIPSGQETGQHNIGYTADGFYKSDDPTNSVKALKEGG